MSRRILFATSNGFGLGHLTRSMAFARRLAADVTPLFFTASQAVPAVREQGFYVEFVASHDHRLGYDRRDWNVLYADRLREVLDCYAPDVVVFDGAYPYAGVIEAARRSRVPFVWSRRGMWRPGTGADAVGKAAFFSHVLEPGEFAHAADRGLTATADQPARRVGPVVLLDRTELLDAGEARRRVGVDADRPAVLIQLGSGSVFDLDSLLGRVVARLSAAPELQLVFAESTIAHQPAALPEGVKRVRHYPLAELLPAFDFVVTAAGYNTFHETLAAGVPALFVPNVDTERDDQVARARWAEQAGMATCWERGSGDDLEARLAPLLDADRRASMRQAAGALPEPVGGAEGAAFLEGLLG